MASDTVERIIQSAENQARVGGYNAFSFREIAKEIGIKSASIHYHFPTKSDLAAELAKRYTEKFIIRLDEISSSNNSLYEKLSTYADLFYHALKVDQKMCLCGLFAAEADILPENVKAETKRFFEENINRLEAMLIEHHHSSAKTQALQLLASLEGAMLIAKAFDSERYFKEAIDLSAYQS